jgi:hypothetical protein
LEVLFLVISVKIRIWSVGVRGGGGDVATYQVKQMLRYPPKPVGQILLLDQPIADNILGYPLPDREVLK